MHYILILVFVISLLSLGYGGFRWRQLRGSTSDLGTAQRIIEHIQHGEMIFLTRKYQLVLAFVFLGALLLGFSYLHISGWTAFSFVMGALLSAVVSYGNLKLVMQTRLKSLDLVKENVINAAQMAFRGGLAAGMFIICCGMLGIIILYFIYVMAFGIADMQRILSVLAGFLVGSSLIALFNRVGGDIYARSVDVTGSITPLLVMGIDEKDIRNPTTIASEVGKNINGIAATGADLFESLAAVLIAAMIVSLRWLDSFEVYHPNLNQYIIVGLPLVLATGGLLSSVLASFLIRIKTERYLQRMFDRAVMVAYVLMAFFSLLAIEFLLPTNFELYGYRYTSHGIFGAVLTGLLAGAAMSLIVRYYHLPQYRRFRQFLEEKAEIIQVLKTIGGLSTGMISTVLPLLIMAITIVIAYQQAHLYGVAMAAVSVVSMMGILFAINIYGVVINNVHTTAVLSQLDPEIREQTEQLHRDAQRINGLMKGFVIGSAGLASVAVFCAFVTVADLQEINILRSVVWGGLFVGGMIPFLFLSLITKGVERIVERVIEEVHRQFQKISGLKEGKTFPKYRECVRIALDESYKELLAPTLIATFLPVFVGVYFGAEVLGAVLLGVILSGLLLTFFMSYLREAIKQSSIQTTHPLVIANGISLNTLMKLIAGVSLMIAPFL